MAPYKEDTHLSKNIIALSGHLAEKFPSSRSLKNIARSTDFKRFLFCLSEVAPSLMKGTLKRASLKCDHALSVEEKARVARKRAASPKSNGEKTKRVKASHPSQWEAESDVLTQQSFRDYEVKGRGRTEDAEKKDVNAMSLLNENPPTGSLLYGQQADAVPFLPSKYQVEIGLVRKTPAIEAYIRAALRDLKPTCRPVSDVDGEITDILMVTSFLEFFRTKRELQHHLESREKLPDGMLQARVPWDTSDPSKILDALEDVMRNTIDNKIHRAYGQTVLFSSVNAQVAQGYRSTTTRHRCDHTAILKELAHKRAGTVSSREIEQMVSRYLREYYAGQKWLAVIEWFGGGGIVLIFIIAEIGGHKKWTDYQRDCLRYLAGYLGSIKKLVEVLGSDALEIYCRNGSLGSDLIDRVKMVQFTDSDNDDEEEGEEHEDEDEDEDEEEVGVGVEIKTEGEDEQRIQNDYGPGIEDGDGDDDTETDTDVDEEEGALPDDDFVIEDEDEEEEEEEDGYEDEDEDEDSDFSN